MPHVRRILYALESAGHDVRENGRGWTVQHCPACGRTASGGRGLRVTTRASDSAARLICNGAGCDQLAILAAIKLPSAALYAETQPGARPVSPEHARCAAAWLAQWEASDLAARAKGTRGILGHGRQRPIRTAILQAVARLWAEAGCPPELEAGQALAALRQGKTRRPVNRQWAELVAAVNGRNVNGDPRFMGGWAWSGKDKATARPRVTVWRMALVASKPSVNRPDLAAREAALSVGMAAIEHPAGQLRPDSDLGAALDPVRIALLNAMAAAASSLTLRQLAAATGQRLDVVERALRFPPTFPPSGPHVLPPAHASHGGVCGLVGGKVRQLRPAGIMAAMLQREQGPAGKGRPAWAYSLGVHGSDWQAWADALQLADLAATRAGCVVAELDATHCRAELASAAARSARMLGQPGAEPGARPVPGQLSAVRRRPGRHQDGQAAAAPSASLEGSGADVVASAEGVDQTVPKTIPLAWIDNPPPLPGLGLPLLIIGVDDPRPSWQVFQDECELEDERRHSPAPTRRALEVGRDHAGQSPRASWAQAAD